MKKITVAMGMALVAPAIWANQYNAEVRPVYVSVDQAGTSDSAIGIGGSYYFAPVNGSGVPLGEAAFLRHASNVYAEYISTDKADEDALSAGIEFYNRQLYLNANFTKVDDGANDPTDFEVALGFMANDTTRITVGYAEEEDGPADQSTVSLALKTVMLMVGETALNLEASIAKTDDANDTITYGAEADYYFNRTFSAGVSLEDSDADGSKTEVGVSAAMFFNEQFGAYVGYTTQDETDTVMVGGALRF